MGTTNQTAKDHVRLLNNLQTLQKAFTAKELSKYIGVSEGTWRNKMKEPWRRFSYDEFKALARFCRVEFQQLVEGYLQVR